MHAPANVLVVLSKISIADVVPLTVAVAIAVRTTLSPARGDERSAERVSPVDGAAAGEPMEGCGTLGSTGVWVGSVDPAAGEAGEGSVVSSHAAGERSSNFAGSAGHWVRPSGRDDWPGDAVAGTDASQAAPALDAGQSWLPAGRDIVGPWSFALCGTAGARCFELSPRPVAGAAASAMMLRCKKAATRTTGTYPVRKNSNPRMSRRSECSYPS